MTPGTSAERVKYGSEANTKGDVVISVISEGEGIVCTLRVKYLSVSKQIYYLVSPIGRDGMFMVDSEVIFEAHTGD